MKTKQIVVRVTDQQYDQLQNKAKSLNKKSSELVREILFNGSVLIDPITAINNVICKYQEVREVTGDAYLKHQLSGKITALEEVKRDIRSNSNEGK